MIQTTQHSIWLRIYTLPVFTAITSCFQLILIDYPYGHDWIFELVRLEEYFNALKAGQIFPYWAENLYHGFGSPIFLYYAPLYNLLSSCVLAFGISLKSAATLSLTGLMVTGAIGMAGLIWEINKHNTSPNILAATRITAIAYVLSPYLLSNLLVRNASAELTALCLAPYPFWGLVMLHNKRQAGIFVLTISLSLSILSHNLTALVVTAMLIISALLFFFFDKQYKKFTSIIISVITGIGITTWFWLPALYLKKDVNIQEMIAGKFDFHNNFTSLMDLFSYDFFYTIGLLPLLVLIAGTLLIKFSNKTDRLPLIFLMTASVLFLFLQLSASTLIWEHLPLIPLFQFPWRMMGPFSFCIALVLGIILSRHKKTTPLVELIIITLLVINAAPTFKRYQPLPDDVSNIIPESITAEGIISNGLPATVLDEYLPKNADKSVVNNISAGNLFLSEPPVTINVTVIRNSQIHFTYDSEEAFTLYPAYWHFPVWQAQINNNPHSLNESPWGTLQLDLPAGNFDVELTLLQPSIRKNGFIISGFFLIFFCLFLKKKMYALSD